VEGRNIYEKCAIFGFLKNYDGIKKAPARYGQGAVFVLKY
jgi:hypothetical protein